jgi:hypothetical protein
MRMWKNKREMWRLNGCWDDESAVPIRANRSVKKDGHCSTYVHRKKSVRV